MSPTSDRPADRRRREKERDRADTRLFDHLGTLHGFDESDLSLLEAIAVREGFTRRSDVFVRPSTVAVTPDADRWSTAQVSRVRETLFGEAGPADRAEDRTA